MKVKCTAVTPSGADEAVSLGTNSVTDSRENDTFCNKSTPPNAVITIPISQPGAKGTFQVGKFYIVEFRPCQT